MHHAVYLLSDWKLTPEQSGVILKSATEKGLDFSETVDGKGVKFIYFGDEADLDLFHSNVAAIAKNAGISDLAYTEIRSALNETKDYIKRGGREEDSGERGAAWHQASPSGSSDLFRRAVDNLLAPYIRLIEQEGYRFSTRKFTNLFGHSDEEARLIEEAVHPKSEDTPPESEPPSGQSGFK